MRSEKIDALVATYAIAIKKTEVDISILSSPTTAAISAVTACIVIPKYLGLGWMKHLPKLLT